MAKKSIPTSAASRSDQSVMLGHYDQTTLALSKAAAIANLICNFDSRSESNRQIKESAGLIEDYIDEAHTHLAHLYEVARGAQ